jgi:hypothetical protein
MIELIKTKGRINIKLNAIEMGEDLCVIVTGGDKPHLGAVTVGSNNSESNTFCFPHHKEDSVTRLLYSVITETFNKNVVVCCGIHIDNIAKEEISSVISLCSEMIMELKTIMNI